MIIKSVKMLFSAICVCISVLGSVELKETGPMEIIFKIHMNNNELVCDHDRNKVKNHKYTVLEGEKLKLKIEHPAYISHLSCSSDNNENIEFLPNPNTITRNITEFQILKHMGHIWKCTILSQRYNGEIRAVVENENIKYAAVYCHMQIHVRQQSSPQTILVNNMALDLNRTDLSEKDIDFTAVYEYADNDIVSVSCNNFLKTVQNGLLSLEYKYADQFSDKFNSSNLSSRDGLGFRARLHSIHNNTEMICIYKEPTDLTKVMVRLIMRTEFDNYVRVTIDGMIIRPKRKRKNAKHYYSIDYKYFSKQTFVLVCEVVNDYTKLFISNGQDKLFVKRKVNNKRAEVSLRHDAKFKMTCGANFKNNGSVAETVELTFTTDDITFDVCSLDSELPPNGTVMELYEFQNLKVIYYEFEEGETLRLTCHSDCTGPIAYLQLNGTGTLEKNKNRISKTRILTRSDENTESNCTLVEKTPDASLNVMRVLKVILLKKSVRTTVAPTTEPSRESYTLAVPTNPEEDKGENQPTLEWMIPVVGGVTFIVIVCVITVIFNMKKRDHSQRPHDPTYENLQSNASIPPHPPQWEQAYAVPVDGRVENETYSVPYRPEGALYSVPLPKSERNKKNNNYSNYATLDVKNSTSRQNLFIDTDDPNYSEICYNKKQIYAQVLPKNERIKQDDNPYSYVTKEGAYVNTNRAEPLYCDPNNELKSQKKEYVNVSNNHYYANSSGQEYVEPTYCEPNKQ